jgi:hypothetical protein
MLFDAIHMLNVGYVTQAWPRLQGGLVHIYPSHSLFLIDFVDRPVKYIIISCIEFHHRCHHPLSGRVHSATQAEAPHSQHVGTNIAMQSRGSFRQGGTRAGDVMGWYTTLRLRLQCFKVPGAKKRAESLSQS